MYDTSGSYASKVIPFICSQKCIDNLTFIRDTYVEPPLIKTSSMVQEFANVFLIDYPHFSSIRDIDFSMELESVTKPISIHISYGPN